jgi:hypothetical protein
MDRQEAIEWQQRLFPSMKASGLALPMMLPEICLALRSGVNGSADEWAPEHVVEVVAMLKARLETWAPSLNPRDARVDAAVWALIEAVIEEVATYMA